MFAPHQATQRTLFRLTFVALCIAPTLGLAGWTAARYLPQYTDMYERRVAEQTGLVAAIAAVEHPRPNETRFEQVELRDPETSWLVASAERVVVANHADHVDIELTGAKLEQGSLADLWYALDRRLRTSPDAIAPRVRFAADAIQVETADSPLMLHRVTAELDSRPVGTAVSLEFRTDEGPAAEAVELRIVRSRQSSPASNGFELHTANVELPCALAAPLWDAAPWLGPHATFAGDVWMRNVDAGELVIRGRFAQVDLRQAIETHFPRRLRGTAELTLERANFDRGRLISAAGSLRSGPGQIERDLLDDAWRALDLRADDQRLPTLPEVVEFQRLGFRFELDAGGISLAPETDRPPTSAGDGHEVEIILVDSTSANVLAAPKPHAPQPIANLVRLLVPASADLVPADDRAAWLLQSLPAVEANATTTSAQH